MRVVFMEVITEYADHRTELEDRIRSLESEQTTLLTEIASLKEKLTTLELERHATSLSNEVEALRTEKAVLEEKVATYSSPMTPTESYQV
jgi:chromosome segregation ATPase